jgi:hypothetical protein
MSCQHCGANEGGYDGFDIRDVGVYTICIQCYPVVLNQMVAIDAPKHRWAVRSRERGTSPEQQCPWTHAIFDSLDDADAYMALTRAGKNSGDAPDVEIAMTVHSNETFTDASVAAWLGHAKLLAPYCSLDRITEQGTKVWGDVWMVEVAWRGHTRGPYHGGPIVTFRSCVSFLHLKSQIIDYIAQNHLEGVPFLSTCDVTCRSNSVGQLGFFAFQDKNFNDLSQPMLTLWHENASDIRAKINQFYEYPTLLQWKATPALIEHIIRRLDMRKDVLQQLRDTMVGASADTSPLRKRKRVDDGGKEAN